jgi:hypothetical protein
LRRIADDLGAPRRVGAREGQDGKQDLDAHG